VRLNKYLSESGACSRREADTYIEEGRVTINGAPAHLGAQVNDGDDVRLDGDIVGTARKKTRPVYIALNKPVGITCTTERAVAGNIVDFVDHPERVFPIGRLDKDSEGLILLTNDGDIVNKILRAGNEHEKEYRVMVDKPVTPAFLEGMRRGVPMLGTVTRPCKIAQLGPTSFSAILTEGLNRQLRRMCEHFDYQVRSLQRVRVMHLTLYGLSVGRWRELTVKELGKLDAAVARSSKIADPEAAARPARRPTLSRVGTAAAVQRPWRRPPRTSGRD
jgi:23S rRNA pseudouridine2604 synthase